MNFWKIKSRILNLILFSGDILSFALALYLSLLSRYGSLPTVPILSQHFSAFVWIFLLWALVLYITGFYAHFMIGYRLSLAEKLFKAHLVNVAVAAIFFYFVQYYYFIITPKVILIFYAAFSYFLLFSWRALSLSFMRGAAGKGVFYFIGPRPELGELSRAFEHNPYYSNFMVLAGKSPDEIKSEQDIDFSLLEERARAGFFAAIVATFPHQHNENFIRKFYDSIFKGVNFFDFQKFYESVFHKIPVSLVNEMWLLENISSPSRAVYDFLKRLMDIIISLAAGIASLFFHPFIIIAIKLDDGGPIFYVPERVGKSGKLFKPFKFRTMKVGVTISWFEKNDSRVTRVGKFLRKTSLDELPQLWNIFLGDISLVGPRPDIINFAEELEQNIPYYKVRTLIKPGLTGWAQVSQHVEGENPSSVEETKDRLAYDIYYIKNRSFLLDLAILAKTAHLVLSRIGFFK